MQTGGQTLQTQGRTQRIDAALPEVPEPVRQCSAIGITATSSHQQARLFTCSPVPARAAL